MRICKHKLSVIVLKKRGFQAGTLPKIFSRVFLKIFLEFWLVEEGEKEGEGEARRSNCLHKHLFLKIIWRRGRRRG